MLGSVLGVVLAWGAAVPVLVLALVSEAAVPAAGGFAVVPAPVTGAEVSGCAWGMPLVLPLPVTASVGAAGGTAGTEGATAGPRVPPVTAGATGAGAIAVLAVSALLEFVLLVGADGAGNSTGAFGTGASEAPAPDVV